MDIRLINNDVFPAQLESIMAEMRVLGAPVIRAVDLGEGRWQALEGCHRVRAAKALGLVPIIEEVEYSSRRVEEVVPGQFQDPEVLVTEIVDECWNVETIEFEDE